MIFALNSKYIDRIIVSTEDKEIAELVSKHGGCEVPFLRPEELALDSTPSIDVIIHAIDFVENQGELYDYIVLLEPTSPLRTSLDIDKAFEILLEKRIWLKPLLVSRK